MSILNKHQAVVLHQRPSQTGRHGEKTQAISTLNTLPDDVHRSIPPHRQFWNRLKQHKLTLLMIMLIALAVSVFVTLMTPTIYRATVQLQIEPESGAKVYNDGTVTELPVSLNQKDFYQTQYELLKSRTLARKVIDKLNLYPNDESQQPKLATPFFTETLDAWKEALYGENATKGKVGDYPVEEEFLQNLTIEPVKKSSLVNLHYDSANPETAKTIANEVATQFISMTLEQRASSSTYAKTFVDDQLVQAKSKLDKSEAALVQYAKDKKLTISEAQQKPGDDRLAKLEAAVTEAEKATIAAKSAYENPPAMPEDEVVQAALDIEDPATKALRSNYAKLQAEYIEKSKIYKPEYPTMIDLQQQMTIMEKQISESSKNVRDENKAKYLTTRQQAKAKYQAARQDAHAKYLAAQQQEAALRKQLEEQRGTLLELREKTLGYTTLQREVDTNRSLYDGLLQRIKEVAADINIAKSNIIIVDPAVVPYAPFTPDIGFNLGVGAAIGLLLGILLITLLAMFDDRISDQKALEACLGLPILGSIPRATKRELVAAPSSVNTPFSKAFFALRTRLMFTPNGLPRVLHITSAMPNDGKSTVCIHLASAFAQTGKKVLLIDGDLHTPSLHHLLETGNREGLSEFLTNQGSPLRQIVLTTQISGVYLLTAGAGLPDTAGSLTGERMHELLDWAYKEFDLVIIDSPAVANQVDSLILAHHASATLLIANAGKSRAKHLVAAYEQLHHAHAHLIGTVLNYAKQGKESISTMRDKLPLLSLQHKT